MTDDQFQALIQYVTERLEAEESFAIPSEEFHTMFDLSLPYYSEFLDRLRGQESPTFSCDAKWSNAVGDPSDPIQFARR
jgi:hypothetical protein